MEWVPKTLKVTKSGINKSKIDNHQLEGWLKKKKDHKD